MDLINWMQNYGKPLCGLTPALLHYRS